MSYIVYHDISVLICIGFSVIAHPIGSGPLVRPGELENNCSGVSSSSGHETRSSSHENDSFRRGSHDSRKRAAAPHPRVQPQGCRRRACRRRRQPPPPPRGDAGHEAGALETVFRGPRGPSPSRGVSMRLFPRLRFPPRHFPQDSALLRPRARGPLEQTPGRARAPARALPPGPADPLRADWQGRIDDSSSIEEGGREDWQAHQ